MTEGGIELPCSREIFSTSCCFKHPTHGIVFSLLPNHSGFDIRVKPGPLSFKKDLDLKVPIVIVGTFQHF